MVANRENKFKDNYFTKQEKNSILRVMNNFLLNNLSLYSDRLTLRILDESDCHRLLNYHLLNKSHFQNVLLNPNDSFYNPNSMKSFISDGIQNIENGNSIRFYMFLKDSDEIIGDLILYNILPLPVSSALLGFKIGHDFQNKGLMKEALIKLINFGFEKLSLHKIEAYIEEDNFPAVNLIQKLGFISDGIAKDYLYFGKQWKDFCRYYLINEKE